MAQPFRVPLDAVAATVQISAIQSATIVTQISAKLDRWIAAKQAGSVVVPEIQDVSILQGGSVWWCRGRAVPTSGAVAALGALLASLLDHTPAHHAPAGLLYMVARATDPRHLAPFSGLSEFHKTLARHAASRPAIAVDSLVARYAIVHSGLPALELESTISDVRRLRRAGGVPLAQIAADTAIPISLLRELEWGVYTHWNLEHARGALELYAERAGLDAEAVARVIEQEQIVGQPALAEPRHAAPRLAHARTEASDRRALPYAFAALALAAVLLGAPGDRSPHPPAVTTIAQDVESPARAQVAVPVSEHPANNSLQRQVTRAVNPVPGRTRQASTPVRSRAVAPGNTRHPLAKFARAIAGDGRYKVEPFPKVKAQD